jgi:formyl-CoA transferase
MGREDLDSDARFQSMKDRALNIDIVDQIVSDFSKNFETSELFDLLLKYRVPCAPVRSLEDVVNDPHLHERGMLQWIDHPSLGRIVVPGSPMRYEGVSPLPHKASADLGTDNEEVLGSLGLSKAEIDQLKDEKVI